jgi:hypothetical protein
MRFGKNTGIALQLQEDCQAAEWGIACSTFAEIVFKIISFVKQRKL